MPDAAPDAGPHDGGEGEGGGEGNGGDGGEITDANDPWEFPCSCGDQILCGDEECDEGKVATASCFHDCRRNLASDDAADCKAYVEPLVTTAIFPATAVEPALVTWRAPIETMVQFADIVVTDPGTVTHYSPRAPERIDQFDGQPGTDIEFVGVTVGLPNVLWRYVVSSDGAGSFTAPRLLSSEGSTSGWMSVRDVPDGADFNGDGRLDSVLSVSPVPYASHHQLRVSDIDLSSATSEEPVYSSVPFDIQLYRSELSFADLNGDHRTDIYRSYQGPCGWSIVSVLSVGDGQFAPPRKEHLDTQQMATAAVRAFDVTGDGAADLVRTYPSDDGYVVDVAKNRGDGRFSAPVHSVLNLAGAARTPMFGDANGDGQGDVLFIEAQGEKLSVLVALSTGDGNLTQDGARETADVGPTPMTDLKLLDVNGDRRLDLVVTRAPGSAVGFGYGDGRFTDWQTLPGGAILTGDFNDDGKTDVLSTRLIEKFPSGQNEAAWKFTTLLAQ